MARSLSRTALLGATFLAGFSTFQAVAQTEAKSDKATQAEATAEGSNDIVVTGNRRSVTLQNAPINISAVSSEQIQRAHINDVRDLGDFTPGLTVMDTGPSSTGTIIARGLNSSDSQDNALAIYLGEVPLYYDFKLLDIARVETLLGPQGTLYGLGTLAGAIRYIPNRPNVTDVEGEVHGQLYGKDHGSKVGYQGDGMVNIPIVRDHIAFRSATGYYYDPGFIDYPLLIQTPGVSLPQPSGPVSITPAGYAANLKERKDLNFEKTFTTRNQLLVQTSEDLKATLTYAYQQTKTDGLQSNSAGVLGTGKYQSGGRYMEPANRHANLVSLEINANIADIADLVSTTSYTKTKTKTQTDNTDLLLDLDYDYELFPAFSSWNESVSTSKQKSQEVRLVSRHGGPFSWVLGGFYNQQKNHRDYAEHTPGLSDFYGVPNNPEDLEYVSYSTSKVTEKAIFGEGVFHITPQWQVTGGARYYKYSSDIQGALVLPLLGDPLSAYDATPAGGKAKQDGWVWKFNSSYNFTHDLMVYATYSKGYRLGGPNRVAPCPDPVPVNQQNACALPNEIQFGPDTTKNLELGFRTQMFDHKLSFNFDVFQVKWDGIQVASATFYGVTGITVNGGSAKSKGFESSFQFRPVPQLAIEGNYAYVDAKLTQDVPGIIAIRTVPNDYDHRPKFTQLAALSGDRLPGSTKNSGSLGATYTMPLLAGHLIGNWTATYHGNVVTRLGWDRAYGDKLPSYVLHRATLTYDTDAYSFGLFATNIFDKYAVVDVNNDRSRIGVNDGVVVRYYGQTVLNPRTFGIEGRIKF